MKEEKQMSLFFGFLFFYLFFDGPVSDSELNPLAKLHPRFLLFRCIWNSFTRGSQVSNEVTCVTWMEGTFPLEPRSSLFLVASLSLVTPLGTREGTSRVWSNSFLNLSGSTSPSVMGSTECIINCNTPWRNLEDPPWSMGTECRRCACSHGMGLKCKASRVRNCRLYQGKS